jgi:uncharacterized protein YecT (DUF1311 family)
MNAAGAPCQQPATNAETARCFTAASQQADIELNRIYGQIQGALPANDRTKLQAAERFWIQYRDADCSAAYDLYGGGSGGPAEHAACLEAQTRLRVTDLDTTYGWLVEKVAK